MRRALAALAAVATLAVACAAPPYREALPPPAPSSPTPAVVHATGLFTASDGTRLFEQSWRPDGPPRGTVVIHHGLKSHSDHYAELAQRLVALGIAVHAYDMRGHGRSEGRRATLDDFGALVDDLARFLERVRAAAPPSAPMFVVGHSVGGAVVTLHQIERRPPIAGLILLAPALRVDRLPFEAAATPLAATLAPNAPLVDVPNEWYSRSPAAVAEMDRDPLIYNPSGPARTAGALLRALEIVWARAREIDVPLLALHGTADRATDPRGSAELVERVRSRDRKLLLYADLYHDLVREPEREQVMDDLSRWLAARLPQGSQESR